MCVHVKNLPGLDYKKDSNMVKSHTSLVSCCWSDSILYNIIVLMNTLVRVEFICTEIIFYQYEKTDMLYAVKLSLEDLDPL